jgi:hypothetical protein
MLLLPMACSAQALLDLRSSCTTWTASSWEVSTLWSSQWKHWSSPNSICILKAILVLHLERGRSPLLSSTTDISFDDWWEKASTATIGLTQKGLNSLIALGAWIIWNHRNSCIFDGANPNIAETLKLAGDERRRWTMAGARAPSCKFDLLYVQGRFSFFTSTNVS